MEGDLVHTAHDALDIQEKVTCLEKKLEDTNKILEERTEFIGASVTQFQYFITRGIELGIISPVLSKLAEEKCSVCQGSICDGIKCKEQIQKLEAEVKKGTELCKEITEHYRSCIEAKESEKDTLKFENAELKKKVATLEYELNRSRTAGMVTSLEEELVRLEKTKTDLQTEVEKLNKNNVDLVQKLSQEWSQKISSNESNIENINIKNRPMNLGSNFEHMFSQEWLDVKTEMDESCQGNDQAKHTLLCDIMMEAQETAKSWTKEVQKRVEKEVLHPFSNPYSVSIGTQTETLGECEDAHKTNDPIPMDIEQSHDAAIDSTISNEPSQDAESNGPSEPSELPDTSISQAARMETTANYDSTVTFPDGAKSENVSIPKHLNLMFSNTLRDILRQNADCVILTYMLRRVYDFAMKQLHSITPQGCEPLAMVNYVQACCRLCWAMSLQSPPMELATPGVGCKWDEKTQEVFFGSEDPKINGVVVRYYVQPTLTHDNKVMVKGKVMTKTETSEEHGANMPGVE